MFSPSLIAAAEALIVSAKSKGLLIATAESCTGGLVSGLLTEIAGSSAVFERGYVTYSNRAKAEALGVPVDTLRTHGAVSEAVARAMAEGALARAGVDASVALTGIAGPGGGSPERPVGLVHIASARRGGETVHKELRLGDRCRTAVRLASVAEALALLHAQIEAPRLA
ncbi:MAG: CinA family protein [Alphaproteobacteria bacterium]|nr:CinA family protein [Alphaproteobacteria bacterium]